MNSIPNIRVCHLTSVHRADDIRIFVKECVSLAAAGFDTHLVAPAEKNYTEKGVHVHGISKAGGRRISRMWKTVNAVYQKAIEINADIYHLHDPELLRIALKLKRKGKKVIYDAHEDVPKQILAKHWIPGPFRNFFARIFRHYENQKVSRLSGVITSTPGIRDRLLKVNKNCTDINNYPLLSEFQEASQNTVRNGICYIGGITEKRGIMQLLNILSKEKNITLELAGAFSPAGLEVKVTSHPNWRWVTYHGLVNRKQICEILSRCKVGMVTLLPTPNHLESQPIKMFEYMAAGLPVIASDFPFWKQIVEKKVCGICVNPFDEKAIQKAVIYLLNHPEEAQKMGENGRNAVLNEYNWEAESKKLVAFYQSICRP
jgi:glycosyltransferase involved in cell wall biosynthesis